MAKWVSVFRLSNSNKWQWWMLHYSCLFWRICGSRCFTFIRWTGRNLVNATPWWWHHKHCLDYYYYCVRWSLMCIASYWQIMKQQPYELRRRLYIMFKGEEGLDYGGIARSVYIVLSWQQNQRFHLIEVNVCNGWDTRSLALFYVYTFEHMAG